jgi:hypothetical protein
MEKKRRSVERGKRAGKGELRRRSGRVERGKVWMEHGWMGSKLEGEILRGEVGVGGGRGEEGRMRRRRVWRESGRLGEKRKWRETG